MRHLLLLINAIAFLSCTDRQTPLTSDSDSYEKPDTLFRILKEEPYELGVDFAYVNQSGDTVVPFGRFTNSYSDIIVNYGAVIDNGTLVGINAQGQKLYEIYWYDNGPDYISDGLFRILKNGLIGYADTLGQVRIEPKYRCAMPFSDGQAKVTYDCEKVESEFGKHSTWESDSWFFIDTNGKERK